MKTALLIIATLAITGCAQTERVKVPAVELSEHWRAGPSVETDGSSWWKAFGDGTLDSLESQALAENLDIQQGQARLEQARSAAGMADASLAPTVNLDASVGRVQQSLNSGLGTLSNFVPNYARTVDPGQLGFSASWDLDFAGGLRHQREAAGANLEATAAELTALRLSISVEVADAYFTALGSKALNAALVRQLDLLNSQMRIMEVRVRVGAASQTDLDLVKARIAEASVPLATLTAAISIQKYRLAVLLGRDPSKWAIELGALEPNTLAANPTGGQPVDLLRRRPDVLAAERRVASAGANVAASMAEYYPRISLSAAIGQDASNYANLDSSRSTYAQSFLGLRWRLFDFGRIDTEVKLAQGKQQESLLVYRAVVLRAASDVETSFSQLAAARERLRNLEEQRNRVHLVLTSVQRSNEVGSSSLDEVYSAGRSLAKTDFDIATARLEIARAIVFAARALGGPIAD
jgi:NodT family efflux transporter outer membrane factor (OMF) lipoprotein